MSDQADWIPSPWAVVKPSTAEAAEWAERFGTDAVPLRSSQIRRGRVCRKVRLYVVLDARRLDPAAVARLAAWIGREAGRPADAIEAGLLARGYTVPLVNARVCPDPAAGRAWWAGRANVLPSTGAGEATPA